MYLTWHYRKVEAIVRKQGNYRCSVPRVRDEEGAEVKRKRKLVTGPICMCSGTVELARLHIDAI